MRPTGILPGVVSAQRVSKRQTGDIAGNFIRDKDKWAGRFAGTFKTVMRIFQGTRYRQVIVSFEHPKQKRLVAG